MKGIVDKYESLCARSKGLNKDGNTENGHYIQDMIYRTFINDINKGKFNNMKMIKKVAKMIKQDVVKFDKPSQRWYA